MLRRTILALCAGLAGMGLTAALTADSARADAKAPKEAQKIKDGLKKLYGKYEFDESLARSAIVNELHGIATKNAADNALRYTPWWSEQIVEALYAGDKYVKTAAKTKSVESGEVECFHNGSDKPSKAAFAFRGPSNYSKTRSAPLLLSFVDSKTNPKDWITKAWIPSEDVAKEWVLVAVAESEAFNVSKDPLAPARVLGRMLQQYNVDPNRIFVEGVGGACRTAQVAATLTIPDRLAGLVLRNPQESVLNTNASLFPTVVLHGPEATEKPMAVLAQVKQVCGETNGIELAVPDLATLEGPCQGLADWLKAAKPRHAATSYTWTATVDKNDNCPNVFTGSLLIVSPVKREEPTTVTVTFRRDSNTADIKCTNLGEFVLCLNDELLDLDKEVEVIVNQTTTAKKVFVRDAKDMIAFADGFYEWGRLFPVQIRQFVSAAPAAAAPEKKPDAPEKK